MFEPVRLTFGGINVGIDAGDPGGGAGVPDVPQTPQYQTQEITDEYEVHVAETEARAVLVEEPLPETAEAPEETETFAATAAAEPVPAPAPEVDSPGFLGGTLVLLAGILVGFTAAMLPQYLKKFREKK